jgi:hypothetical protein
VKRTALITSLLAMAIASVAHAAEPRPWLCRDKPVFSSQHAMRYQVTMTSRSRWQLFLMQFSPGGGNDGFDIAQRIGGSSTGPLAAGRYFAVALRNSGGNWICPPVVSEKPAHGGTISDLCFATDEGECSVEFVATPDPTTSAAPSH